MNSLTTIIGVSLKALLAAAHCVVVDHLALSRGPAGPGARVATLLIDTGQVTGALAVDPALGSAVGRCSHIARQAGAGRDVVLASALGVWSTWVRITGIHWPWRCLSLSD